MMEEKEIHKFISFNAVKRFLKDNAEYRISNEAISELQDYLNRLCNKRGHKLLAIAQTIIERGLTTLWRRHFRKAAAIHEMKYGN